MKPIGLSLMLALASLMPGLGNAEPALSSAQPAPEIRYFNALGEKSIITVNEARTLNSVALESALYAIKSCRKRIEDSMNKTDPSKAEAVAREWAAKASQESGRIADALAAAKTPLPDSLDNIQDLDSIRALIKENARLEERARLFRELRDALKPGVRVKT